MLSVADRVVVDGDGDKHLFPVNGGGGGGGGGRRQYGMFAPSHPQAVNQYIRSYTHGIAAKDEPGVNYSKIARDIAARTYTAYASPPFRLLLYARRDRSGKRKTTFWCLFVRLFVRLSVCPIFFSNVNAAVMVN